MLCSAWRLRAVALLLLGVLGVHELSYLLVPDSGERDIHSYLSVAGPLVAGLFALVSVAFIVRLAESAAGGVSTLQRRPLRWNWISAGSALFAIYVTQEGLERLLSDGNLGSVASVFSLRLVVAFVLALVLGLVIVLALRGAANAIESATGHSSVTPGHTETSTWTVSLHVTAKLDLLARFLGKRGPPELSI